MSTVAEQREVHAQEVEALRQSTKSHWLQPTLEIPSEFRREGAEDHKKILSKGERD